MRYKSYVATYAGQQGKVNNDNYLMNGIHKEDLEQLNCCEENKNFRRRNLYAVSSGINCDEAGDELALVAVELLRPFFGADFKKVNGDYFALANGAMNSRIFEKKNSHFEVETSVLFIESDVATVFNIGDVPVYFFENGSMRKLNGKAPETVEIEKIFFDDSGIVQTEIVEKKNIPYLCYPDEDYESVPFVSESIKLKRRAYFLLCSKAVLDTVGENEIFGVLNNSQIKGRDKASVIVDLAVEKNPDGNYTVEIVEARRGLAITDGDVKSLGSWLLIALLCGGIYYVGPFVIKYVSEAIDSGKELIQKYTDDDVAPQDDLKWVPKKPKEEEEPEPKEEAPEVSEEPKKEDVVQPVNPPAPKPSRPKQQIVPQPSQKTEQSTEPEKPTPQPPVVEPVPETSALPEPSDEGELPIDFN